ncbi:putative FlaG/YvyC family protein [Clostridium acetobutylicum]|uniref:Lipoprotein n=1 Tax=Clostridium acetobutylicum (strain ATCC 824 / DSM 792 / JCM 1419 / IAM 19013 / LMG 5710 / NBRC 13948 / NRRL B-527 / VKM B-1787 / 2291 / W) TaxID=272562 RepID=Q97HZ3_CLOAB|nr:MULTISPECIES: hypothetical protein [Clostridium]AAK79827.1 Hypothetical protein CA_C1863 [Clostridium acetobutylicum ATCC 824]ADZ20913.1 Conserved hypothetical protein [Clostridium acetobutylicum EA 2018]AEI32007.1 hypothetical protein SMB_G1888 [Clostridium acetobutylicum DSM 1731]AWV79742.1 hypothetical protein DK921_06445 [Clostridium acetobutylicum]MBC2394279.1 hypothetical protein [Clostridium acetobutylicum]
MNKKILAMLILLSITFSACTNKSSDSLKNNSKASKSALVDVKKNANITTSSSSNSGTYKSEVKPSVQLSTEQKKQVNQKLNSALKNMNNALKSIQDPSDIDLSYIK